MANKKDIKKKKYWLRGGIILLVIIGILFFYSTYNYFVQCIPESESCPKPLPYSYIILQIVSVLLIPIIPLLLIINSTYDNMNIIGYIIMTFYIFLVGSLIGWLYGIIKNKLKN